MKIILLFLGKVSAGNGALRRYEVHFKALLQLLASKLQEEMSRVATLKIERWNSKNLKQTQMKERAILLTERTRDPIQQMSSYTDAESASSIVVFKRADPHVNSFTCLLANSASLWTHICTHAHLALLCFLVWFTGVFYVAFYLQQKVEREGKMRREDRQKGSRASQTHHVPSVLQQHVLTWQHVHTLNVTHIVNMFMPTKAIKQKCY